MSSLFPEKDVETNSENADQLRSRAHMERGVLMAQLIMGMVHTPIPRHELLSHPQGRLAITEEAEAMRSLRIWNESELQRGLEIKTIRWPSFGG